MDAGNVGSGQMVTALYKITPLGGPRAVADLRYARPAAAPATGQADELGYVRIRYKLPKSDKSRLIAMPIGPAARVSRFVDAPREARFATAVAGFAELLRGGRHTGAFGYDDVLRIATASRGEDAYGYRDEFIQLVRAAKTARTVAALDR